MQKKCNINCHERVDTIQQQKIFLDDENCSTICVIYNLIVYKLNDYHFISHHQIPNINYFTANHIHLCLINIDIEKRLLSIRIFTY